MEAIHCESCEHEICKVGDIFYKEGARNEVVQKRFRQYGGKKVLIQSFANHAGYEHELVTSRKVNANVKKTKDFNEKPWFEGYEWSFIVCIGCGDFVGWSFQKPGKFPEFYGLVWNIDAPKSTDDYESEWYLEGKELCIEIESDRVPVRVGDTLEVAGVQKFGNPEGDYQHWGVVYQVSPEPLMMHFTTGNQSSSGASESQSSSGWFNVSGISSASASQSGWKGGKGNATIVIEKISTYERKLRINNSKDKSRTKVHANSIRQQMQNIIDDPSLVGQYNLVKNNCEHFANYIRYGKRESDQAENHPLAWMFSKLTFQ